MNKKINFEQIELEKLSWVVILVNIIGLAVIVYTWFNISQFNKIILIFAIGISMVNILLTLFLYKKDILVEIFLLNTSVIIQILLIILIFHSL